MTALSWGRWLAGLVLAHACAAAAQPLMAAQLNEALRYAAMEPHHLARPPLRAPTLAAVARSRSDPLEGLARIDAWVDGFRTQSATDFRPGESMLRLRSLAYGSAAAPLRVSPAPALPAPPQDMPIALREPLNKLLVAVAQARAWQVQFRAPWPVDLNAQALWSQQMQTQPQPQASGAPAIGFGHDVVALLSTLDPHALGAGMQVLVDAAQAFQAELSRPDLPSGSWNWPTPLGEIRVDTTGAANTYRGERPLLLIDRGGDDDYQFGTASSVGIHLLFDHGGHDHYQSDAPGTDPSAAVLGYALLWDSAGDDTYRGQWLAQGAAVLGAALHIDSAGHDRYEAKGMAQGFALGGVGVLISRGGADRYQALTQAQGAAGPCGVAVLLDFDGDDHYVLAAQPLVAPASQLPDRNASLGQGAAHGWRAIKPDQATVPGGVALLVDLRGDDRYEAQVFAQGAGIWGGLGVLFDDQGTNRWNGAWYVMGAAAHEGGALFVAAGEGGDTYTATHSTALGAAHDDAVALFMDRQGDDSYRLSTLGFGAAHDHATAAFVDVVGNNRLDHTALPCRGFGASVLSGTQRDGLAPGVALYQQTGSVRPGSLACPMAPAEPSGPNPTPRPAPG